MKHSNKRQNELSNIIRHKSETDLKNPGVNSLPLKPQSSSPTSSSSLGVISPIAALCRIHAAKTPQGDHPSLLQPLQIRIVIFPPTRIFTRVQEIDLEHWQILKLVSVVSRPMFTEATIFASPLGHVRFVRTNPLLHIYSGPDIMRF